jgi:hypothetical protein
MRMITRIPVALEEEGKRRRRRRCHNINRWRSRSRTTNCTSFIAEDRRTAILLMSTNIFGGAEFEETFASTIHRPNR